MPPSADRRQSCPAPPHRCLSPAWCSLVMVRWRGLRTRSPTGNWRIPHPAARSRAQPHSTSLSFSSCSPPAQPSPAPIQPLISPASVEVELTWGPATHLHKHHGHGSRGLVTGHQSPGYQHHHCVRSSPPDWSELCRGGFGGCWNANNACRSVKILSVILEATLQQVKFETFYRGSV